MRTLTLLLTWLAVCTGVVSARPYDTWKQTHFGANAGNPAIAGDAADPDGDGWVNAIEYAFGTRPTTASAPQWESDGGSASLKLHFVRTANADLDLFVEKSSILQPASWQVVAQSIAGAPVTAVDPDFGASETPGNPGEFAVLVKQSVPQDRCLFRVRAVPAYVQSIDVQPGMAQRYPGQTQQFTAAAMYSDGVQEDVTELSVWSSSAAATATVSNAAGTRGLATAISAGTAGISAVYAGFTGNASLDVLPVVLTSLAVTPANPSIAMSATQQFTATGTFSDASTQNLTAAVTWTSSQPAVATVSNAAGTEGLATGVSDGSSVITATLGMVSGSTTLTVNTPVTLVSIAVTPANPSVLAGTTQQFTATGTFSDASTQDLTATVTWSTGSAAIATISNAAGTWGLATALAEGSVTVAATLNTITGSTGFTVFQLPTVLSVSPGDSALGISPGTAITVTFSQPMNPATLTVQTSPGAAAGNLQLSRDGFATCLGFTGPPVMSAGDTVATFTPSPALTQGTTWQVRITTGAQSATGYSLASAFTQTTGFTTATEIKCGTGLVISQIYGGGGNTGSVWKNDFIELYNPTNHNISTSGYAVQYASTAGSTWNVTALTAAIVPPGGYYLVQEAAGTGGTTALPTPNATGTIAMSATGGKVALTSNTTALTGAAPASAAILDLIGWGTATFFETSAAPATVTNATLTTAVLRKNSGSADSNNNGTDCLAGTPNPRNSSSPAAPFFCPNNETSLRSDEADYAAVVFPPALTVQTGTLTPQVFAQIFETTYTEAAGPDARITCQIGYGPSTSNPQNQAGWTWVNATYNTQVGNNDEYAASFTAPAAGDYRYTARFSVDGANWTYADSDGAGSNAGLTFDTYMLPVLTVTP